MSRCEAHRPEAPGEERPGQFPVGPGAIRAAGLRHPGPNQRAPRADQNSAAGRGEFLGHGRGPARPPAVGRAPGHGGQLDRPDGRVGREERECSIERFRREAVDRRWVEQHHDLPTRRAKTDCARRGDPGARAAQQRQGAAQAASFTIHQEPATASNNIHSRQLTPRLAGGGGREPKWLRVGGTLRRRLSRLPNISVMFGPVGLPDPATKRFFCQAGRSRG